ncbi:Putative HerA helicase [Neorhizobium galegae bv. officinalis]|uniref:Putative HerA helicase n=1 Tax=Neorhizobium galegae bv. officinalis TaxID=323656 RepID=A0A0T7G2V0_NEOGA|nr:ATP-binding protein [Neorhizobium galegae]CDZ41570.1 Putative HerA helicase [Neorhizobium galegae bv. officinalis]
MTRINPINPERYIGTITQVTASYVHVNLPQAAAVPERRGLSLGAVGDFVFVDCERFQILGRIVETKIPDAERLTVEPSLGKSAVTNPIGKIQLLAAVEQRSNKLRRGLPDFPRIGDGVYLAEPSQLATLIRNAVANEDELTLSIGRIDAADGVDVCLPPEKIFGRHCGVFGATGGGKSWTVATLVQQLKRAGGRAIVLDPTGEFADMGNVDEVFVFDAPVGAARRVHFPYRQITEDDLFSLFRPSGQSQGPRLREAIKSLKLVAASAAAPPGVFVNNGLVEKAGRPRAPYFNALHVHAAQLHDPACDFDITNLAEQVKNECVWASSQGNAAAFGNTDQNSLGYCESLIARINTLLGSRELECIFKTNGTSLVTELRAFLADDSRDIAVISFKDVRFEHNTREILLNVIGRFLLAEARAGAFRTSPLVVFLDEAHQFLGRSVGDEHSTVKLDSFGLIAKEGRKYGLTCVLATQRPRDIPQDVMSQLGTLFVHRLTNDQDRETVERACGDLDRGAAQFVPMLAPGEAVVIGPDIPAPVPLFIHPPEYPPDSKGPEFQSFWRGRRERAAAAAAVPEVPVPPIPAPPIPAPSIPAPPIPIPPPAQAVVIPPPPPIQPTNPQFADDLDDEVPF